MIKGAMADGPFSFAGRHYTITDYDARPKPVQRPRPPILIGGGGRRVLSIAAREADIVGINGSLTAGVVGPEAIATMTRRGRRREARHRPRGRRRPHRRHRAEHPGVPRQRHRRPRRPAARRSPAFVGVDEAMVAESPFALIGSTATIADELVRRREELGFSYVIVGGDDIDAFAPVVAQLAGT